MDNAIAMELLVKEILRLRDLHAEETFQIALYDKENRELKRKVQRYEKAAGFIKTIVEAVMIERGQDVYGS